ncbi:hypothetical protein MTO96_017012 [Rhipicephalus appendiculatus]
MATREKERKALGNAAEALEGAQDTGPFSFSWCLRSGWNDAIVRKALWEDKRSYVLGFTLSVNAVLILLAVLVSLTECNNLQVTVTCLRHSTLAMLYAAAFSWATRFLSLSAVKASVVKKFEVEELLGELIMLETLILLVAFFACLYHVGVGITIYQTVRREEYFAWYLQLPADVVRVQALAGAMVLTIWLVFLMGTDIRATFRAQNHLWEARRRGDYKWQIRGIFEELANMACIMRKMIVVYSCVLVLLLIFFILSPDGAGDRAAELAAPPVKTEPP